MKLTLYKECKIRKNDVIEKTNSYDILTYLGTLEKEEVFNLNLSKNIFNEMTVSIKLNRKLREIDVYSNNYAMIEEGDERYFYFIADKQWVADSTTRLVLFLDTCNTFEYKDTIISDTSKYRRCNVIREHRDRFTSANLPIIDRVDEGFGTLPMEIKETKLLGNDDKYYLGYYQSPGANARTVCKIFKDEGEDHTRVWYNFYGTIGKYLTEVGQAMMIYTDINKTFLDFNADPKDKSSTDFWDNKNLSFMYILRTNADVYIRYGFWSSNNLVTFNNEYITKIDQVLDLYSSKPFIVLKGEYPQSKYGLNKGYLLKDLLGSDYTTEELKVTAGLNFTIPGINDTIKADSNILKIIEIPYFQQSDIMPYYDYSAGTVVAAISDLTKYSMSFSSKDMYSVTLPTVLEGQLADKKFETKLLGSQFTTNMFKYDSFNYSIAAEDLTLPQTTFDIDIHIPIDMSTTVGYQFKYTGLQHNEFDRWLITQRNNQIPTMTNKYLEYMQNGYNYDVKNRNIQTAMNWASWATGAAITGATGGLTIGKILSGVKDAKSIARSNYDFDTGSFGDYSASLGYRDSTVKKYEDEQLNSYYKNGGAYSVINIGRDAAGVASGLVNNIVQTVQSKQALEKRKKDYLNSSENISNSDDVTLFNIYNGGNKLRYSKYQPRDEIVNNVSNVLRICGYATNQEKIPVLNTRWFYNYLQADVEFKGGKYIPTLMLGDIQSSIAQGITLFHYKKGYGYDLDRKYENWENVLSGGSPTPGPSPEPTPGELTDLIVTGDTVLRDDGYFYYVSYQITNPNNLDVTFNGIFREDEKTILQNFSLKAGETIGDKLEVDGKNLTLLGTLSKKEN